MDSYSDYESAASLVDSMEASNVGEQATIDVGDVFANRLEVKTLKYAEADRILERGEVRRTETVPAAPQQPRPQAQAQVQVRVPKREVTRETVSAASRLRSMVGGAGKELAESVSTKMEQAKEAELVMPKLSVQDQLSDLEKIKEGLNENVFNDEQLGIIVDEIKGMSQISAREDTSRMSADQRELVLMRNQRIKEIKGRLNIK